MIILSHVVQCMRNCIWIFTWFEKNFEPVSSITERKEVWYLTRCFVCLFVGETLRTLSFVRAQSMEVWDVSTSNKESINIQHFLTVIASVDEALRLFSGPIVILTKLADLWLIAKLTERIVQVRLWENMQANADKRFEILGISVACPHQNLNRRRRCSKTVVVVVVV